jgi:hypothetical protein
MHPQSSHRLFRSVRFYGCTGWQNLLLVLLLGLLLLLVLAEVWLPLAASSFEWHSWQVQQSLHKTEQQYC